MNRLETLALSAALLFGALGAAPHDLAASATPAPTGIAPAPTASPNPAVTARSKAFYHALQTGTVDRTMLSSDASSKMTDDSLKAVKAKLAPLGDPVTFEQEMSEMQSGSMLYAYLLSFGNGTKLEFVVGYDGDGKISALALRPAEQQQQ
jgi:hypothetical protein